MTNSNIYLWDKFLAGDKKALESIYKESYDLLLNYGLKFRVDEQIVKDCIHDLFLKLYLNKPSILQTHVHSYLLKSLRNMIFTHLSKINKERTIDESFDLSINDPLLDQLLLHNDNDLRLTRRLIDSYLKLNSNQKQIIYLKYVKELSHKEIAAILNIKEQSSMDLLHRTLLKLRKLIKVKLFLFFM